MLHPFVFIPDEKYRYFFWPLAVMAVIIMLVLNNVGAPLTTEAAPAGIISYELAGDLTSSRNILNSWDDNAHLRAAFVQGLDYLFIPVYVGAIGLGCAMAAKVWKRKAGILSSIGTFLAWALPIAGLLDTIENVALVMMLFNLPVDPWPQIAFWCAAPKFVIVLLGILYTIFGGLFSLAFKNR